LDLGDGTGSLFQTLGLVDLRNSGLKSFDTVGWVTGRESGLWKTCRNEKLSYGTCGGSKSKSSI